MFIDSAYFTRNGKKYRRHLLRESFRENGKVKHHTWANLSHCTEEEISALKLALKHKGDLAQLVSVKEIRTREGGCHGAVKTGHPGAAEKRPVVGG